MVWWCGFWFAGCRAEQVELARTGWSVFERATGRTCSLKPHVQFRIQLLLTPCLLSSYHAAAIGRGFLSLYVVPATFTRRFPS